MRVLITGAKGLLGTEIMRCISNNGNELGKLSADISKFDVIATDINELDIRNFSTVRKVVKEFIPDIVINCAAYLNANACEFGEERQKAFDINVVGVRNLAIVCEENNAKLMHFSSDYVFSGVDRIIPYTECDTPAPLSVYGYTKSLGDKYVAEFCSKYYILRTAWMYGKSGKSFVETILHNSREKGKVTVVNDQRGTPTNSADLAYHAVSLLQTDEYGLYNASGSGDCTWYDFAKSIVKISEINAEVIPCTSEEYKMAAKRPSYSVLDNMMFKSTIGDKFRDWEMALHEFLKSNYR